VPSLCVIHGPSRSSRAHTPIMIFPGVWCWLFITSIYISEIGPLVTATSVSDHLYNTIQFRLLQTPMTALLLERPLPFWVTSKVSCKPGCRLTVRGSTRQKPNLSVLVLSSSLADDLTLGQLYADDIQAYTCTVWLLTPWLP